MKAKIDAILKVFAPIMKESIDTKTGRGWFNLTFGKKLPAIINGTVQESRQTRCRLRTSEKGTYLHTNLSRAEIVALAQKVIDNDLEAKAFSFRCELFQNKDEGGFAPIPNHEAVSKGSLWVGKHSISYGDAYMGQ